MNLSTSGAAFVRIEEGFVGRFYLDATGTGTIGIGFTWASAAFRTWWSEHKPGIKFGPGVTMTRDEAEQCLIYCFANEYGKAVNVFLGHDVPQNVFDGMASPVYNMGSGSLEWKWAAFAKAGDYAACADALRITGTSSKGKTLAGLVRRRKEEANLIQNGVYAGVGAVPVATHDPVDTAMLDGVLTRGERGPAVAKLISNLSVLGYYKGKLDDQYGYGTEAAVLAFQRDHGLSPDGDAGDKTLKAIAAALVTMPVQPAAPAGAATAPATVPVKPSNPVANNPVATVGTVSIIAAIAVYWHQITAFISNLF